MKNIRVVWKLWIACFSELLFSLFISNRSWPETVAHFVPRHANFSCLLWTTDTISSCFLHSLLVNRTPQQSACEFPPDEHFHEEVLLRVNEQSNILHEIRKWKAKWIGHILRRNCLLKQVIKRKIKGEMEVTRRRGRRRKKLLDDLKDRRGYSHLKEEALDRTMWKNHFGGGFGPVVRQNTEWMINIFSVKILSPTALYA